MIKIIILQLLLCHVVFGQAKVKNPLISKADKAEEDRREKQRKKIQKAQLKKAKKIWKRVDKYEKELSPWSTWYHKSLIPGLLKLSKTRKNLYKYNLKDPYMKRKLKQVDCKNYVYVRTAEGVCNDLNDSSMGSVWTRFGRNTDPRIDNRRKYDVLYPDPRKISLELMERDEFKPVGFLNLLAVPWIQFMTHDWFSHGDNEDPAQVKPFILPLAKGDPLGESIIFPKSMIDTTKSHDEKIMFPQTFRNEVTHWWDGSQVYGSSKEKVDSLRTFHGGKLKVKEFGENDVRMVQNSEGLEETGFNRNWWLGLSLLHNLFTLEHNKIADALAKAYPKMNDEALFQKARMINAALIAKIHTVEWTPAIIPNKTLERAMGANWYGLLNRSPKVKKWFEFFKSDFLFGLVGGKKDLAGTPFAMTEEFVSVYRMHPLLPDNLTLRTIDDHNKTKAITLQDTRESGSTDLVNANKIDDLLYSFGHMHPGQLTLKNYPKTLMNIEIPFVGNMDLAAMDILRDRERNVPRYNEFRKQMGLKKINKFEDLTKDEKILTKLKEIYDNDVEAIDLLVGCLAETVRPTGFGFGETAFQVFIAMASRRLVADRFYTDNYNKETYTKVGIDWVDENNMKTVLLRNYPRLKDALFGIKNAFNPWNLSKQ